MQLPDNLVAVADIEEVVKDADILVFCVPHQFMRRVVSNIKGKVLFSDLARMIKCFGLYDNVPNS